MALWAVLFLEYWKRKNATLAYRWDCSDYEDIEVSELGRVASGEEGSHPTEHGSLPGKASAPVRRQSSDDSPEPHHWGR